jgi:hypothetical protein
VFLSAARLHFVVAVVLLGVVTFSGRLRHGVAVAWVCMLIGAAYIVSNEARLQRFTSLGDTEMVVERVGGSVNKAFFDLLQEYPLGNGMGGGGTSIPFFLEHLITNHVGLESEFSRILLEEGLAGLVLWIAFMIWVIRRPLDHADTWLLARQLMWFKCITYFVLCFIGIGLMTAIPQTPLFFLSIGFLTRSTVSQRSNVTTRVPAAPTLSTKVQTA